MGQKIALGTLNDEASKKVDVCIPRTDKETIDILSMRLDNLTRRLNDLQENKPKIGDNTNKDGLQIGISLVGESNRNGIHILTVKRDGYYIGTNKYESLSAAAEASSGVRRSGWTYWKYSTGINIKESIRKG